MTSEELAAQHGSTQADRQQYITELTDDTTFHFLYQDPQNEACHLSVHIIALLIHVLQGARGIFQLELILSVFAYHLGQTNNSSIDYGYPAGALGLSTAAVRLLIEMQIVTDAK